MSEPTSTDRQVFRYTRMNIPPTTATRCARLPQASQQMLAGRFTFGHGQVTWPLANSRPNRLPADSCTLA